MKQEVKYCIKIYQDIRIELYIYFTKKGLGVFGSVFREHQVLVPGGFNQIAA